VACGIAVKAQAVAGTVSAPGNAHPQADAMAGGVLHGVVRNGKVPLPGVTVTARNTLTGRRYSTTTDINGVWSIAIPLDGHYVVRAEFAAFAPVTNEALVNAASRKHKLEFQMTLASRAAEERRQQNAREGAGENPFQQLSGSGAENLLLTSTSDSGADTSAGVAGDAGVALPSVAGNSDFSDESVAVTGQSGQVSPMAGVVIAE